MDLIERRRWAGPLLVCIGLLQWLTACAAVPAETTQARVHDPEGQWQRASAFIESFAASRLDRFDEKGKWVGDPALGPWRALEHSAYVNPFLQLNTPESVRLANAIIENHGTHQLDMAYTLVKHNDKLTPAARTRAEKLVKAKSEGEFQQFRWKHFQGDNDNFQLMAAATIAMWGEHTGDRKHTEDAHQRLEEFKSLLSRRGFASEFNSPAYLGLHLHPLALIAETTTDDALRKLAIDLETRIWLDLFCHYHPPSGVQGGPWAREYNFDIYGSSFTRLNLFTVLGDDLPGDWKEEYKSENDEHGLLRAANRACVRYHCPAWLVDWVKARRYPFQSVGTAEGSASYATLSPDRGGHLFHWDWKDGTRQDESLYTLPAWDTRIVQYQTADYSLGTANRPFTNGKQCYTFVATLPAKKPLTTVSDTVRILARYIIDEHKPGVTPQSDSPRGQVSFQEAGRSISLQHKKTAMVLYRPNIILRHQPTSLKAMVHITNKQFGEGEPRGDEIYLGDQKVDNFTAESDKPLPVFIRIGDTYMALIPLINSDAVGAELMREAAVRVRPEGYTLGVSFYSYQGPPLELNNRQYCMMGNGFVCEMGSQAEDGSFADFRKRFAPGQYEIEDYYRRTVHSRGAYTRHVTYRRDGLTLETEYNPTSEGIRYQAINGVVPTKPQIEADGLPYDRVPFLAPR